VFCPYGLYPPAHRASVPRARHVPPSSAPAGCLYAVDASCSTSPGGNLHPEGGSGPPVAIETRLIVTWGIWVDGRGVVEGADTEGAGHHLS
jgi:hypothetical protein